MRNRTLSAITALYLLSFNLNAQQVISGKSAPRTFQMEASYERGLPPNLFADLQFTVSKTAFGTIKTAKSFYSILEELKLDKRYYVRSYFVIDNITVYGNELSFITLDGKPELTTAAAIDITTISATSGGSITDEGGAAITARGVCWNTSGSPIITDSKTNDGSGTGSFSSSISGLSENTTYYVRGLVYGTVETNY